MTLVHYVQLRVSSSCSKADGVHWIAVMHCKSRICLFVGANVCAAMLQLVHHSSPGQQDAPAEALTESGKCTIEVNMQQAPPVEASRSDCWLAEHRAASSCVKSSQPGSVPLGKHAKPGHICGHGRNAWRKLV